MFTGIITDRGTVREVRPTNGGQDARLVVGTAYDTSGIALGASIACSGACLTVVEKGDGWFAADASRETLDHTTLGGWKPGTVINLERPLCVGDELGGHIVTGHVDSVGRLVEREIEGGSLRLVFEAPPALARYIASKGSVAVDGVSLTVNQVDGTRFGVNVIPHTREETSLGALEIGNQVNLEVDILARYVARQMNGEAP